MENPYDPIEEAGPTPDGIQDCSPTPRYEGDQQFPAAAAAEGEAVQQQQQLGLELDSPRRSESSSVRIVGEFPGVGRSEPKPPAAKRRKIEDGVAGVGKGHDQAARKTPIAGGKQEVLRSSSSNKATTFGAPASSSRAQPSMLCSLLQKNTKWKPGGGRAETSKPPSSTGNANPGLSKTSASTSAGEGVLPRASSGAGVAAAEPSSSVPPALSSAAPARPPPQRPISTTNDEIILLDESDDEEQEQLQEQQPATSIGVQAEQKMREEILKLQRVSKYWRGTTKGPHQDLSDENLPNYVTVIRNALPEGVSLRLLRMVLYGDLGKNFEEKDWWVFGRKGKTPRKTYVYWNDDHDQVEQGREENKSGVVEGEAVAGPGASSRGDGDVPTSSPAMRRAFETVEGLVNHHLGQYLQKTPYPLLKKYPPPRSWRASYALGNWYRDGADNVGPHQDSLTHLGPCPIIASLSLGAGREFVIERRGGGAGGATGGAGATSTSNGIASANPPAEKLSLMLLHGDVLIMWPGVQEEFTHSVPKMANPLPFSLSRGGREVADRINWTFRMEREEYFRLTPRCDCRVGVVAPSTTATAGADGGSSSSSRGDKDKENVLAKKKLLGREQVEGPREQDEGVATKNNTTVTTDHVLENRLCNLKPMVQNWGGANFGKYLYRCNPADRSEKPCKFLQVAPWSLLEGGLEAYLSSRGAGAGGGAD